MVFHLKNHTRYEHNRCNSGDKESGPSTINLLFAIACPKLRVDGRIHSTTCLASGVMVKSVWQEVAAAELQESVEDGHDKDLLYCYLPSIDFHPRIICGGFLK